MVAHRSRQVLVIHPGALGDVLQAVPALSALRALDDERAVAFAGQPRLGRFLAAVGLADEALDFDALGLDSLFAAAPVPPEVRARLGRFDRVVSWFGARAAPFPERLSSLVPGVLIAPAVPETGPPPTVWEHLLGTLVPWGVAPLLAPTPLVLPEAWREEARRALSGLGVEAGRPLLVVHPGAGGEWKRWPAEAFAGTIERVADETGSQVLVHEGPADRRAAEELSRALGRPTLRLVDPALELLAGVLQEAAAYLGGDSGVSHLAAAAGVPAVILFPPATLRRWAPWSSTAVALPMATGPGGVEAVRRVLARRLTAQAQTAGPPGGRRAS
jgi:heptosyltransferase-3